MRKIPRKIKKGSSTNMVQDGNKIATYGYPDMDITISYDEWGRIISIYQKIGVPASRFPKYFYIIRLEYEYNHLGFFSKVTHISNGGKGDRSTKSETKYKYDCHNELLQKSILTYADNVLTGKEIFCYENMYDQNDQLLTQYMIRSNERILRVETDPNTRIRTIWNNNGSCRFSVVYRPDRMDYHLPDGSYAFSLCTKECGDGIRILEFVNPAQGDYRWYLLCCSDGSATGDGSVEVEVREPFMTAQMFMEITNFIKEKYPNVSTIYLSGYNFYAPIKEIKQMQAIALNQGIRCLFSI